MKVFLLLLYTLDSYTLSLSISISFLLVLFIKVAYFRSHYGLKDGKNRQSRVQEGRSIHKKSTYIQMQHNHKSLTQLWGPERSL